MSIENSRSSEDVEKLIELAKLDSTDLEQTTQMLFFTQNLATENMVLMEVDNKLLDELSHGKRLVLRGGEGDTAIMCSDDVTYEVREAATSNLLLLAPGLELPSKQISTQCEKGSCTGRTLLPKHVSGLHRTYLEPRECQPKMRKLRKLLEENPYKGPEYEPDNDKPKYTLEDLLSQIQATESQLLSGLAEMPAYLIDGFYRAMDFDYLWRVFSFLLDLIESNSWSIKNIPRKETITTLEELVPRTVMEQCFDQFCEKSGQDDQGLYELRQNRVCRFHAEILLRNAGKFHREEFLKAWQNSVPEGLTTDTSFLKGVALEDCTSKPEVIFFYPVWELPENIPGRLDALFNKKEKWTYEEIEPYLRDLSSKALSISALLTKFARSSTKNGIRLFSSKHPLKK